MSAYTDALKQLRSDKHYGGSGDSDDGGGIVSRSGGDTGKSSSSLNTKTTSNSGLREDSRTQASDSHLRRKAQQAPDYEAPSRDADSDTDRDQTPGGTGSPFDRAWNTASGEDGPTGGFANWRGHRPYDSEDTTNDGPNVEALTGFGGLGWMADAVYSAPSTQPSDDDEEGGELDYGKIGLAVGAVAIAFTVGSALFGGGS